MIPQEAANFKGERAQGGHGNTHGLIWINNESINGGDREGQGKVQRTPGTTNSKISKKKKARGDGIWAITFSISACHEGRAEKAVAANNSCKVI